MIDPTCYVGDGSQYRGSINVTIQGDECLSWNISDTANWYKNNSRGHGNFCRNPNGNRQSPWCYVRNITTNAINWAYCPIPKCLHDQPTMSISLRQGIVN